MAPNVAFDIPPKIWEDLGSALIPYGGDLYTRLSIARANSKTADLISEMHNPGIHICLLPYLPVICHSERQGDYLQKPFTRTVGLLS